MSTPLLQIDELSITFAHPRPAVRRVDLTVHRGEVLALVGESGSGKSMTARAVLGLLPEGARAAGSVRLAGTQLLGADERTLRSVRGSRVALVFQEPQSALNPVRTVGWQIREALRAAQGRTTRAAARARAIELLREVEIPDPEDRVDHYPHQLSGGQKQRVAIALALAGDPDLLIADEPTTALDVTVQAEILALLDRIRQRTGMGVLLITHNMGVVAQMADRVLVLRLGEVVEEADTATLFRAPQHAYTRQLLAAVPRLPEAGAIITPGPVLAAGEEPVLVLDRAEVTYPPRHGVGAFTAVRDVSFEVRPGEVLGLVGESGSGKTTLGRVAAGLVPLADGRVLLAGDDLAAVSRGRLRELRRDLAFVHQDPAASLDPRFTVATSIREPLDVHGVGDRRARNARVRDLLEAVRLEPEHADRLPHELSGGQRQRVALARALALAPKLLIADEPTSALDVSVQAEVLDLFERLQRELGFASIFISHDLAVVHRIAHRVVVLRAGEVVETGPVERVFADPRADYTRDLVAAVPVPEPPVRAGRRSRLVS